MPQPFVKDVEANDWFIFEDNGLIIGSGYLDYKRQSLEGIFVDPNYQGQGLARKIIDHLEKIGQQKGFDKIVVEATFNAEKFYNKLGYVSVKKIEYNSSSGLVIGGVEMYKIL